MTLRVSLIAPLPPMTSGVAPFNAALAGGLAEHAELQAIGWSRLYPRPRRRSDRDPSSAVADGPCGPALLDWLDPRTWRRAARQIARFAPDAVVLPWLHPVMAPPYRWLLDRMPRGAARVLVCHNVLPHEPVPLGAALTRAVLSRADVLVTHAAPQRDELARLRVPGAVVPAFLPRLPASALGGAPAAEAVRAERRRHGDPDLLLLAFGAVRPYKGIDVALEALARVRADLRVRLVVAGRMWSGGSELAEQARRLGLEDRVDLQDRYVPDADAALLFAACDAALLPYRAATQSGVVQLAFAQGRPVIATAVGGLPEAVRHGVDGLLCPPEDPGALAAAIERMALESPALRSGVAREPDAWSPGRYAYAILDAVRRLPR